MVVYFFEKGTEVPAGLKKVVPRTRQQKLAHKVALIRQLASPAAGSLSPKDLEALGETAEKLLMENKVNIYESKNSAGNKNVMEENTEFTPEEMFAPEGYAESLTVAENAMKALKKAQRAETATATSATTGKLAMLSVDAPASTESGILVNEGLRANILGGIARHQAYKNQGQALINEAKVVLKTAGITPELRKRAKNQYNLGKSYISLADIALEKYRKNFGVLGGKHNTHRHRHKTHRRRRHTHRRKTHHNRK